MTTLEYNGTEKSFAAWGLALEGAILTRNNCRPDTYTVTHPHASAADPDLFPYEARVIIRRGRVLDNEELTGGTIAFVGYCISATLSAAPEGVLTTYTFANAWWLLERTPFQQRTASKTVESLSFPYQSQVILFARLDQNDYFEKIDSGTQIAEALNHCRDACLALGWSAPYQLGTIDPALDLPTWTTQEISCAAVIQKALELSPDCTVDWDYTTSPPTVSVRARANRTAVTLALAPGQLTGGVNITPRHDIIPRAVILWYRIANAVDGDLCLALVRDKYGPNGANSASDPDSGPRVLLQTFDLAGTEVATLRAYLHAETCHAQAMDGANPDHDARRAWFAQFLPWLGDAKIRNVAIFDVTITDSGGEPVSLDSYPRVVMPDSTGLGPWMKMAGNTAVEFVDVTIKSKQVYYEEFDAETGGNLIRQCQEKTISVRCRLTNGTTGDYDSVASIVDGEEVPQNIAKTVYESLATLQYQGRNIRVAAVPPGTVTLANTLNLTGGRAEWATMAATIQTISEDEGRGLTSISFGPAEHLNAGDLLALFRFNRARRHWYNPAVRETGKADGLGNVDLGLSGSHEDSAAGRSWDDTRAVTSAADQSGKQGEVSLQAGNRRVVIRVVKPATGGGGGGGEGGQGNGGNGETETSAEDGCAIADLADIKGHEVKFREVQVCVEDGEEGATIKYMKVWGTELYDESEEEAEEDNGGGGGGE